MRLSSSALPTRPLPTGATVWLSIERMASMCREIYYVEDDVSIAEGVRSYLESHNYRVEIFPLLSEARHALQERLPDLLLLDWNLPDGGGDVLCGWVRRQFGDALPVLFLTIKAETPDVIEGFAQGAYDYLVKPFELEVLYARIGAVLKRAGKTENPMLSCGRIRLNREGMRVYSGEEEVMLNPPEYELLLRLMENRGKTVTRERLLEEIWDAKGNFVNDNTLTVTMKRLREKLGNPSCMKTVRSFGYRMEETS